MMEESTKILKGLNFYKIIKLLNETCTSTMLQAYKILYKWRDKLPHRLADHLNEIPVNQAKKLKELFKGPSEIDKIQAMMADKDLIKGFDITFYYKLIQYAVNNDKMKSPYDPVWTKNCPQHLQKELEHLLFLVKKDRNDFNHKDDKFMNLQDEDIKNFCDILLQRLPTIIRKCGKIAERDQTEIDGICQKLINEIEEIRVMKDISSYDEKKMLKVMIKEDLMPKLIELNRCFTEELRIYCPPNFKLENGTMTTEKLLSDRNLQLICINAETGFGKTSFTKFVQCKLLSEIEKAGDDDLGSWEIPIQISCRKITGRNVSDFLEKEIPISRHHASSTSSLEKFLERFPILWIIDGYDEKTAEFTGFFDSLLKTVPDNHKIIVTSRPNSMKELKEKLKGKAVCEVSIECFDDQQMRKVAKNYLGEDKVADFESALKRYNETLKLVKIPIRLSLCLKLWSIDPTNFDGEINSIYHLYDKLFENQRNQLVIRLKGMANITSEDDLKVNVKKWFKYLCEVVAESAFTYDLNISEVQKEKVIGKASDYGLIGTFCLSEFLDTDKSSVIGTNYLIRHKTEKEFLSCVYLKECDDDALKAVVQQPGNHDLLNDEYGIGFRSFEHLKFLMEYCNSCEFARIFVPLLEIYSGLQRPDCLLQIKDGNHFDDLKTQYKSSCQSLVLHVYIDDQVGDLLKVLGYLMPDLNSFKLIIDGRITMHKETNDFISKYKDRNSFYLKLGLNKPDKFVSVIQMFTKEGNQNLIKELDLNQHYMYKWTEEMKKELFKLESLKFVAFYVWCFEYSWSMLDHFANEEIDSKEQSEKLDSIVIPPSPLSPDVHPPQNASTTTNPVPLQTPSSTSLAAFDISTNLHFNIMFIGDSSKVISDIIKVNSKFPLMSVKLNFNSTPRDDLPDNLLRRFLSRSVQVKELIIDLKVFSKFPNVMKLVNSGHIETLELLSQNKNVSSSVSEFESFYAICDFDKINKIKQIHLSIHVKSLLKLIYNKLSSDLLNKTRLVVYLYKSSVEMEIVVVDSKQFQRIDIQNSNYLSASEIDQLKSISKSVEKYPEIKF